MPVIDPALRRAADLIVGVEPWRGMTVAEVRDRAGRAFDRRIPIDRAILKLLDELDDEVRL